MKSFNSLRHEFASRWLRALSSSVNRRRQKARTNVVAGEMLESRQLLSGASSRVGNVFNQNANFGGIPRQPPTGGAPSPVAPAPITPVTPAPISPAPGAPSPVAPTPDAPIQGIPRDPGLSPIAPSHVAETPVIVVPVAPPIEGVPRDPGLSPSAPSPVVGSPVIVVPVTPPIEGLPRDPELSPSAPSPVVGSPVIVVPVTPPIEGLPRDPVSNPGAPSSVAPTPDPIPNPVPPTPDLPPIIAPPVVITPPIVVAPPAPVVPADIVAVSVEAPSQLVPGSYNNRVSFTIENQGGDTGRSYINYRVEIVSADGSYARDLDNGTLPGLSAGQRFSASPTFRAPSDLPKGDFIVRLIVDTTNAVSESNENNNIETDSFTVEVPKPVAYPVQLPQGSWLNAGNVILATTYVANPGALFTDSYDLTWVLSRSPNFSSVVSVLGTQHRSGIGAGNFETLTESLTLPSDLATGDYYIGTLINGSADGISDAKQIHVQGLVDVVVTTGRAAGDRKADTVTLEVVNGYLYVSVNKQIVESYRYELVRSISVFGSSDADTIDCSKIDRPVTIDGGGGNDVITGGSAGDFILGGDGNDKIIGNGGDDSISGEAGNDTIQGSGGNDSLFGGAGNDKIIGDGGNDLILGEAGNDIIQGGDGNDTLKGGDGNDNLQGQSGDDWLTGNAGNDAFDGGKGEDLLVEDGDVNFTLKAITLKGLGNDTLAGIETVMLTGGVSGNRIDTTGFKGKVILNGGDGNDTLIGTDQADELHGDGGDDLLQGRGGDDLLYGGAGSNSYDGGKGFDQAVGKPGEKLVDIEKTWLATLDILFADLGLANDLR